MVGEDLQGLAGLVPAELLRATLDTEGLLMAWVQDAFTVFWLLLVHLLHPFQGLPFAGI